MCPSGGVGLGVGGLGEVDLDLALCNVPARYHQRPFQYFAIQLLGFVMQ